MSDLATPPAVPLGSYIGVSVLTALIASFLGPLLFNIYIALTSPGGGGIAAGLMAVIPFTFAGAIIAFPIGVLALLLIGVPLARRFAHAIHNRPLLALLTGLVAGAAVGGLVGTALFGLSDVTFTSASLISGAAFGFLWMLAVRFILPVPISNSDA